MIASIHRSKQVWVQGLRVTLHPSEALWWPRLLCDQKDTFFENRNTKKQNKKKKKNKKFSERNEELPGEFLLLLTPVCGVDMDSNIFQIKPLGVGEAWRTLEFRA